MTSPPYCSPWPPENLDAIGLLFRLVQIQSGHAATGAIYMNSISEDTVKNLFFSFHVRLNW